MRLSKHIPGRPTVIVENMRGATTLGDEEFLADAGRSKLGVDPVAGEQFEQVVSELFGLNGAVVARLRELLR